MSTLSTLLERPGPFADVEYEDIRQGVVEHLSSNSRVLIVGAGGLGCEILKDVVLAGFRQIDIIDMDIVDISNLNRQFLFRPRDVGKSKAQCAAQFMMQRHHGEGKRRDDDECEGKRRDDDDCGGLEITAHWGKIQSKDAAFYRSFDCVICGLDSEKARSWMNQCLINLVRFHSVEDVDAEDLPSRSERTERPSLTSVEESTQFAYFFTHTIHDRPDSLLDVIARIHRFVDPTTVIPMVDGGVEGLGGQVRVFRPRLSWCFECQRAGGQNVGADTQAHTQLCTIAARPRIPEHCIQYARLLLWPRVTRFASYTDYDMTEASSETTGSSGSSSSNTNNDDDNNNSNNNNNNTQDSLVFDTDDVDHVSWVYQQAAARAEKYGIQGVTYELTLQVLKNIIPAVACTNAIISAACVQECLKLVSTSAPVLDNYWQLLANHEQGCSSLNYHEQRNPACSTCRRAFAWQVMDERACTVEVAMRMLHREVALRVLRDALRPLLKLRWLSSELRRRLCAVLTEVMCGPTGPISHEHRPEVICGPIGTISHERSTDDGKYSDGSRCVDGQQSSEQHSAEGKEGEMMQDHSQTSNLAAMDGVYAERLAACRRRSDLLGANKPNQDTQTPKHTHPQQSTRPPREPAETKQSSTQQRTLDRRTKRLRRLEERLGQALLALQTRFERPGGLFGAFWQLVAMDGRNAGRAVLTAETVDEYSRQPLLRHVHTEDEDPRLCLVTDTDTHTLVLKVE